MPKIEFIFSCREICLFYFWLNDLCTGKKQTTSLIIFSFESIFCKLHHLDNLFYVLDMYREKSACVKQIADVLFLTFCHNSV